MTNEGDRIRHWACGLPRRVWVTSACRRTRSLARSSIDIEPNKEFARRFVESCRQIMDSGEPCVADLGPYTEPDGTLSYYRRYDIPFRHPVTGEEMLIGLAQDMTDRARKEQQERQLAAIQREMQIAREIQRSLIPRNSGRMGGTLWVQRSSYLCGGRLLRLVADRRWIMVLALGDVSGHGVGPALVAAECRAYWRSLTHSVTLREAVGRLNGLILDDISGNQFVTFASAKLSVDGKLEVFSAGAWPPGVVPDGRYM